MNQTAVPHPHAWVPFWGDQHEEICDLCGAFPNTPAGTALCYALVRTDITKEEVVRRQLETAIALFFYENDEIASHVLARSAAEILTDLCKAKNIQSWRDLLLEMTRPGYEKFAIPKIKEAYNYFKHASPPRWATAEANFDPFAILSRFHSGENSNVLFGCCWDYKEVFGELPSVLLIFTGGR